MDSYIPLGEIMYFHAAISNATTSAPSDASANPTWVIYEEDGTAAAVSSGTMLKVGAVTGFYHGSATLAAGSGFEVGKWYGLLAQATAGTAGHAILGRFRVSSAESTVGAPNVYVQAGTVVASTLTDIGVISTLGSGTFDANLIQVLGTAANGTTGILGVNAVQISGDQTAADNLEIMTDDNQGLFLSLYNGPEGPGVYADSTAANTNTVIGTDGTPGNPVSTLAAARTIADALGIKRYYIGGGSSFTLSATHQDWHFVGLTGIGVNTINLGAAASATDVDRSIIQRMRVVGTQGGAGRVVLIECQIDDAPAAEVTTLDALMERCEFAGDFEINATTDNVFDSCWSGVAGNGTPVLTFNGASGAVSIRHYSGGIQIKSIGASQSLSIETDGQVIFNADCNVNATVVIRGNATITDNTAGMNNLTVGAVLNQTNIQTWVDNALGTTTATLSADVNLWKGTLAAGTAGTPIARAATLTDIGIISTLTSSTFDANLIQVLGTAVTGTQGFVEVNVAQWKGTTAAGTEGTPIVRAATLTAAPAGTVNANLVTVNGTAVNNPVSGRIDATGTVTVTGTPTVNVVTWLGTAAAGTQGTPRVVVPALGTNPSTLTTITADNANPLDQLNLIYTVTIGQVTQDATTQKFFNPGGTQFATATVADDGSTFTRGKMS